MVTDKSKLVVNREVCPLCGEKGRKVIFSAHHNSPGFPEFLKLEAFYGRVFYEAYYNGGANRLLYEIAECNNCHFIYLTEVLSDIGMELLYNAWLDKEMLRAHYSKMPHISYHEYTLGILGKHFPREPQPTLMDFGAGYGRFVERSVEKGFKTFAYDISADKNEFMDRMGVGIINRLSSYKDYFKVIWVNQVLEHVADPLSIVRQLAESLMEDGLIYIAVPDSAKLKLHLAENPLSKEVFKLLSPHQHINAFTNETLKLLGRNSGLVPMAMADYLRLYSWNLLPSEFIFLLKRTIKNSTTGTALLFRKRPTLKSAERKTKSPLNQ